MAELIVLLSAIVGATSVITTVCCWNIRRSRCVSLECKPCFKLERQLMVAAELELDTIDSSMLPSLRNSYEDISQRGSIDGISKLRRASADVR